MIHDHLSILLVVLPLLAAPITALLPNGRLPWLFNLVVTWICFGLAAWLLNDVAGGQIVHYELGGWAPPWGIAYRIDAMNALIALIVAGVGALASVFALASVEDEIEPEQTAYFYSTFQLCLLGLLGIALTGDIFNLFVFLEISSLSAYALISLGQDRRALTASFQYLILGTIGATFFLIGVGLAYAATGTLNMADLAEHLTSVSHQHIVHTAFGFIFVGVALKMAMYPLHLWLPNAYTFAPSVVSVFLAATATKVAVYVLLRSVFTVFSAEYVASMWFGEIMVVLGAVGVIFGSIQALYQDDLKRVLAYSSIAQIGYLVLGIGFLSQSGLVASLVHLFNHALMKAALFMIAGILVYRLGTTRLSHLAALAWSMPWTFAAFVIAGLSLIGVPGTVGFISKWYLVLAAIEKGAWLVAVIVLVGSMLAVLYIGKVVELMYFTCDGKDHAPADIDVRPIPLSLWLPTWVMVLACLFFGLNTDLTVGIAATAAQLLLGGGA